MTKGIIHAAARATLAVAAALLLSAPGATQNDDPVYQRIRREGLEHSRAYRLCADLSDSIGSRLTGSPSFRRAADWAMQEMRRIGLQNVHLEDAGVFGLGWESTGATLRMLSPSRHDLVVLATPWSAPSRGVVSGDAITAILKTDADLDRYRGKLRGRIVFLGNAPTLHTPFAPMASRFSGADVRSGAAMADVRAYYAGRSQSLARASASTLFNVQLGQFLEKEGVAAVVLPTLGRPDEGATGLLESDNQGMPGGRPWRADERVAFPILRTTVEDFGRVQRTLESGARVEMALAATAITSGDDEHIYNVVGELPATGAGGNGEYVVSSAHLDSWLGGSGATDNGAGDALVLESARLLVASKATLHRSVRFVLFGGEEQGHLGSSAYADAHFGRMLRSSSPDQAALPSAPGRSTTGVLMRRPEYDKVSAIFNMDAGTGKYRAAITGGGNPRLAARLQEWTKPLADLGLEQVFDEPDWPADQVSFSELGIPSITFLADPLDYDSRAHHTNMDTVDRLSAPDLAQASVVVASMLVHVANDAAMLPRGAPHDAPNGSGG